jgi:glycosyltransferase involved in cell wall biosynthesis
LINKKITISVVTVCKNAEKYIEETLLSVINQKNKGEKFNLEYIIYDGNSEDRTNNIIQEYTKTHPEIKHYIENDEGLYDGLVKGFSKANGEIVSYINAGDFYYKNAFSSVVNFFENNQNINWITGAKVIYNENSEIVKYLVPFKYRRNLIFKGAYGKNLPFIQQESTFWKKKLFELVDFNYLKTLKKSGDMYLWHCFAKDYDLYTVDSYFSGFKFHENQLTFKETGNTDPYLKEASKFLKKKKIKDYFHILIDGFFWMLSKYHSNILNSFNKNNIIYDIQEKQWVLDNNLSNKYVAWACEINRNQGEGKLAQNFLNYLSQVKGISVNIKTLNNKIKISKGKLVYSSKELIMIKNQLNFFEKYLNPLIGVIYLWYNFLRGRKVIYVNFLPLWNFLLFLLLPPGSILGPITGTTKINSQNHIEKFLRKYIMPYTFQMSMSLINFRRLDILFATESLRHIVESKIKNRIYYNFSLNEISSFQDEKINNLHEREFDFCLYFRKHPNKNEFFFKKFIDEFEVNFPNRKLIIFGDDPEVRKSDKIKFLGIVDNKIILDYLNQTKFSIVSDETLFSFFMLDCLSKNVGIFYNKKNYTFDKRLTNFVAKFHQINFNDFEESLSKINEVLNKTQEIPNYKFEDFKDYYSDYFLKI